MTSWSTLVEVLALSVMADGSIGYRRVTRSCRATDLPDQVALALAWSGKPPAGAFCHSTSWRVGGPGAIILTYAAGPGSPARARALRAPAIVSSGDPLLPAPQEVHEHHIAAHAVCHLVDLAGRDPAIVSVAAVAPAFWFALRETATRTPTATHEQAHLLAGRLT
jgi:hypothetical protein